MTTRTIVEKRYEVLAPSAAAALRPIEQLVEHWPCHVMHADTSIVNVVSKKNFIVGRHNNSAVPNTLSAEELRRVFFVL